MNHYLESDEKRAFIHPKTLHGILLEITDTDATEERYRRHGRRSKLMESQ